MHHPVIAVPYHALPGAYKRHNAKAIISIVGPEDGYRATIPSHIPLLRLEFSDVHCGSIWKPADLEACRKKGLIEPTREDVFEALRFARQHATHALLVHCHAGVSRSPAIALAILADRLGKGQERAAVAALRAGSPNTLPNPGILALADALLDRGGAIQRALGPDTTPVTPHDLW